MIDKRWALLHNMYLNVWRTAEKQRLKDLNRGLCFNCNAAFYTNCCLGNNLDAFVLKNDYEAKQKERMEHREDGACEKKMEK